MTSLRTGPAAAALAVLFSALLVLGTVWPAGAAHAASSRFWGYYQLQGSAWQFAPKGPDQIVPADGAVEGWRYAVAAMEAPRMPRATPTFDALCSSTPAAEGKKRVGVVLDFGRPADAPQGGNPPEPRGACASVPAAANGLQVLQAVSQVRADKGIICGVDGFPAAGCFEEVPSPAPSAAAPDQSVSLAPAAATTSAEAPAPAPQERTGFGAGMTIAAALLTLLAIVAAIWMTMRRRSATPRH